MPSTNPTTPRNPLRRLTDWATRKAALLHLIFVPASDPTLLTPALERLLRRNGYYAHPQSRALTSADAMAFCELMSESPEFRDAYSGSPRTRRDSSGST